MRAINQYRGFTLWELVVVLTIAAVLTSIAIPTLSEYTQQRRSDVIALQIVDAFRSARADALRLHQNVTICRIQFAHHPVPGSGDRKTRLGCYSSKKWNEGLLAFVKPSGGLYGSGDFISREVAFESAVMSPATVTPMDNNIELFFVHPDSTIWPAYKTGGSYVEQDMSKFCFKISQVINRKTFVTKLTLNKYGDHQVCKLGIDRGCNDRCE